MDILDLLLVTQGLQDQGGKEIATDLRMFLVINKITQMPLNIK